jgi:uncharacterized protein with GYD domain
MTTFITRARLTKEGLNAMITAPENRAEIIGRLIAQVGGKLVAYYLTSGEYDILLIFEAPSYEEMAPALIVAAAGAGVTDFNTVTALTSSEMKTAFAKAAALAASYPTAGPRAASPVAAQSDTDPLKSESRHEGETSAEEAKAATAILEAEKKAMDDIRAGRPAPYYLTSPDSAVPSSATSPSSSDDADTVKK